MSAPITHKPLPLSTTPMADDGRNNALHDAFKKAADKMPPVTKPLASTRPSTIQQSSVTNQEKTSLNQQSFQRGNILAKSNAKDVPQPELKKWKENETPTEGIIQPQHITLAPPANLQNLPMQVDIPVGESEQTPPTDNTVSVHNEQNLKAGFDPSSAPQTANPTTLVQTNPNSGAQPVMQLAPEANSVQAMPNQADADLTLTALDTTATDSTLLTKPQAQTPPLSEEVKNKNELSEKSDATDTSTTTSPLTGSAAQPQVLVQSQTQTATPPQAQTPLPTPTQATIPTQTTTSSGTEAQFVRGDGVTVSVKQDVSTGSYTVSSTKAAIQDIQSFENTTGENLDYEIVEDATDSDAKRKKQSNQNDDE